jgi:hypothetical protein
MAQLTGINKISNETSNLTKYVYPSELDDDLNESLCELLCQSNETHSDRKKKQKHNKCAEQNCTLEIIFVTPVVHRKFKMKSTYFYHELVTLIACAMCNKQ